MLNFETFYDYSLNQDLGENQLTSGVALGYQDDLLNKKAGDTEEEYQPIFLSSNTQLAKNQLASGVGLDYQDDLLNHYKKASDTEEEYQPMFLSSNAQGDGIFGADNRQKVNDTLTFPFSGIARITTYWSNGEITTASGALVSPYHLLVAGHTIHSLDYGGLAQKVEVMLGSKGSITEDDRANFEYYGIANSVNLRVDSVWANKNDYNYDWGLITLDRNIGNYTGWFNYGFNNNISNGTQVNIAGYSSDFFDSDNDGFWDNYDMTYQVGTIDETTELTLQSTDLDVAGGSSGSPVWIDQGNKKIIYGIVSNTTYASSSGPSIYNEFTRITESRANTLNNWISEDNASQQPIDKSDLVDYDEWFNTNLASMSSTQITPGNSFSISAIIRNNGTATSSSSISVSFYASTDSSITTNDYKIGDIVVSSITPFTSQSINWTGNFPKIPTNNYYVGWAIDSDNSIQEFDELNNIGILENTKLSVTLSLAGDPLLQTPIYRFYNTIVGNHFFTASSIERDTIIANLPQLKYEGIGFRASNVKSENLLPVYRLYNTIAGDHFFTMSEAERNSVIKNLPQYKYEGIEFYAYGADSNLGQDIYRFRNTVTGGHFFTISQGERDTIINTLPQYSYEGVAFEAGL